MKKYLFAVCALLLLYACNSNEKSAPVSDTEVANAFIRNMLDNKLADAETFLLKDAANNEYFQVVKEKYATKDKAELEGYKNADIVINEITHPLQDSVTIVNYSNTYKKDTKSKLRLIRHDGKWQVDIKYSFNENL